MFYPRRCPVCTKVVRPSYGSDILPRGIGMEEYICPICYKKLTFIQEPYCVLCGRPIKDEQQELCEVCKVKRPLFERNRGLLDYSNEYSDRMIWELKYNNKREYADFLSLEMARRFGRDIIRDKCEAIIPVPVHPSRKRKRGYNQAELIADGLSEYFDIPVDTDILFRIKKTTPQKELGPATRYENLKSAFAASADAAGYKRVLLIDDIYTTGATLNSCTHVLKNAGIQKVYGLTACMAHSVM